MAKICNVDKCNNAVFGKGYCRNHQYLRPKKEAVESKLHLYVKPDSRDALQKKVETKKDAYALDKWFKDKMRLPKICENCGSKLDGLSEIEWHGSQHHILDKAIFKSVKTHELNHLVLGFYCCHSQYHTSISNAKKMPIWNYAKRKVQMFIDEVLENHKILEHYK